MHTMMTIHHNDATVVLQLCMIACGNCVCVGCLSMCLCLRCFHGVLDPLDLYYYWDHLDVCSCGSKFNTTACPLQYAAVWSACVYVYMFVRI